MIKFDFDNKIEFEKMWEIISECVETYAMYIDHLQDRRKPHLSLEDFLKNYNKDLYDTYTYYEDFAYNIRRLNEEICLPTEQVGNSVRDEVYVQSSTQLSCAGEYCISDSTNAATWTTTAACTTTGTGITSSTSIPVFEG